MKQSSKFQIIAPDTINIMDIINALQNNYEVIMVDTNNEYRPEVIIELAEKNEKPT